MISLGITEEQEMIRDAMREFAEQAMRPIARECDEASSIPDEFLNEIWQLGLSSTLSILPQDGQGTLAAAIICLGR